MKGHNSAILETALQFIKGSDDLQVEAVFQPAGSGLNASVSPA